MSTSTQDSQTTTVPPAAALDPAMNAANDDTAAGAARSRKKMYKNCDRCRQAKRACSAQYVSIAEALANKVACKNCKKKGEVCTFNSLINSFGGIPLAGLTGAAFAESLQETSNGLPSENTSAVASNDMNIDETLASEPESSRAAARRRDSQSSIDNVNAVFELLNSCDDLVQPPAKRRKASALDSQQMFSSYAGFVQPVSNAASNSLVLSRAQSPFAEDESDTSVFDILGFQIWGSAPSVRLAQTVDRQHLNSDLLNVYEGAAESAFRVWVTDATTPYLLCADSLSSTSAAMSLNKKVTLLDHASKRIFKADNASRNVEKRVSEAYHAVLLAYAAQWPRHRNNQTASRTEWKPDEARIRLSLWKQARDKLMDAADAWSFRIVFALILFAWTEKPREVPDDEAWGSDNEPPAQLHEVPSLDENSALDSSSWQINAEASTMMLATAMRKLKAFRLKIQQLRRKGIDLWSTEEPGLEASQVAHRRAEATLLENTYHNLYWFGCMMDTELSVLRKYDAVIGDEDSDLTDQLLSPQRATSLRNETESFATGASATRKPVRKIWDEVIPANSQKNRHTFAKSWPCSEEDAKRTLAYATPIKVLLFRHVGRLQSSYWRQASSEQIERQITHVLSVVRHWDETFAPFFASCIAHHHELPPSIQSWHVITATKWNLAAILLVELVQTIDRSAASSDPFQNTDEIFAALRTKVCLNTAALIDAIQRSSLARVPSAESPFEFIHATDSTVLHSDPWPEISVHGFACVAKCEIKQFAQLAARSAWAELEAAEQRVHKCIWALDQLSNRSTMAVDASAEVAKLLEVHSPFKQQQRQQQLQMHLARDEDARSQSMDASVAAQTPAIEAFLAGGGSVAPPAPMPSAFTDEVWASCLQILSESEPREAAAGTDETPDAGSSSLLWPDLGVPSTSSMPLVDDTDSASSEHSLSPTYTSSTVTSSMGAPIDSLSLPATAPYANFFPDVKDHDAIHPTLDSFPNAFQFRV